MTNGSLQNAMQIKADKSMNIYGNLYLAGLMHGSSGTFTRTITSDGEIKAGHGLTINTKGDAQTGERVELTFKD